VCHKANGTLCDISVQCGFNLKCPTQNLKPDKCDVCGGDSTSCTPQGASSIFVSFIFSYLLFIRGVW
jgi:hypothetical protein